MRIASFSTRSPPHSSKYFLTSTKIASATVFLVPGFSMRMSSFGRVVHPLNGGASVGERSLTRFIRYKRIIIILGSTMMPV